MSSLKSCLFATGLAFMACYLNLVNRCAATTFAPGAFPPRRGTQRSHPITSRPLSVTYHHGLGLPSRPKSISPSDQRRSNIRRVTSMRYPLSISFSARRAAGVTALMPSPPLAAHQPTGHRKIQRGSCRFLSLLLNKNYHEGLTLRT